MLSGVTESAFPDGMLITRIVPNSDALNSFMSIGSFRNLTFYMAQQIRGKCLSLHFLCEKGKLEKANINQ